MIFQSSFSIRLARKWVHNSSSDRYVSADHPVYMGFEEYKMSMKAQTRCDS
jgi:hypothetical protein